MNCPGALRDYSWQEASVVVALLHLSLDMKDSSHIFLSAQGLYSYYVNSTSEMIKLCTQNIL